MRNRDSAAILTQQESHQRQPACKQSQQPDKRTKNKPDDVGAGDPRCFLDASGDPTRWRYGANWSHACGDRLKLLAELYAEDHLGASSDELNSRLGCKYRVTDTCKIYAVADRSLLTARDNRPIFECVTGLMFEF